MKINFIRRKESGTWTYEYSVVVEETLKAMGVDVVGYSPTAREFRKCDGWFLQGDTDYDSLKFLDIANSQGSKIIGHHHGGPELLGYYDHKEQKVFYDKFKKAIPRFTYIIFNTSFSKQKFIDFYRPNTHPTLFVTGYPINRNRFRKSNTREYIVVPGRLANDKQPLLTGIILQPWVTKVIFAVGKNPGKDPLEAEYANTLSQMGYTVRQFKGREYDSLLEKAKVVFTASLRDTLNVSILEGALAGAVPVVPNIKPFNDTYSRYLYDAYQIQNARSCIYNALDRSSPYDEVIYPTHVAFCKTLVKLFS